MSQTEPTEARRLRQKQVPVNRNATRDKPLPSATREDRRSGKRAQKRHRPSGQFKK